ncbi:conserved hypothetical protein [Ricinus communis]|uniref:RNase H type-1 domain-containing protein n=1 Tax=Ricinus communis TaxID=3988 RepID=B9SJ45_RICCO|nr:conserved hypothetical protein [Ricinus communis]
MDKRGLSLINWETATSPRSNGGLGICKLQQANLAFLAKLGWRVLKNEEQFSVQVIGLISSIQLGMFLTS